MYCGLFLTLSIVTVVKSYNIDTSSPYVIRGESNSFFGFSSSLHRFKSQSSILVGAPRASWGPNEDKNGPTNPGAVYDCKISEDLGDPTEEQSCDTQVKFLENNKQVNEDSEDKTDQWLGVNVQSNNEVVTACAHRYMWKQGKEKDKRLPVGKCVVIGASLVENGGDGVTRKVLFPCKTGDPNYEAGSCQVGSSQYLYDRNDKSYLFYGAPGQDFWEGKAYLATNLKDTERSKEVHRETQGTTNRYNGFATVACSMTGETIDFITSAPRDEDYLGRLHFYVSDLQNTNEQYISKNNRINEKITGKQMGEYYGYSMACGDLNNDGYDDLIVAAPWYSRILSAKMSVISVGRVYVYNGDPSTVISNANKPTIIEGPSHETSAFGIGLANIGDINKDGFIDFAIGAPYENEMEGAVYIFHGSINGIKKAPAQTIRPENLKHNFSPKLKTFGWSISGDKDLDTNKYNDLAIGAYSSDKIVFLRSLPIIDLDVTIVIPSKPVNIDEQGGDSTPETEIKICFKPNYPGDKSYTIEYTVYLDYKKEYSPRAYFSGPKYSMDDSLTVKLMNIKEQCSKTYQVFLKRSPDKSYIEVKMTANIKKSDKFEDRAVLKQEQIDRAKGKIVLKSACDSLDGICKCDIELKKPTVTYKPEGYSSIVLNNVKSIVVKYEVSNKKNDNAYVPVLRLKLPPKVYFIRRTPVDDQTEKDVSQITCSEIEENTENFVECFLTDPLKSEQTDMFGISLSTQDLTDTSSIDLVATVSISSPSEEENLTDNEQNITLQVGRQANLAIRGTPATPRNVIKSDPELLENDKFLREVKLEVRHTVSVTIEDVENEAPLDEGINDVTIQINWPLKTKDGDYLLYLTDVYVKENLMKDNFEVVSTDIIDIESYYSFEGETVKRDEGGEAASVHDVEQRSVNRVRRQSEEEEAVEEEEKFEDNELSTNCSVPDKGCKSFFVKVNMLKSGSINMKRVEFEMRSILWLPTIIGKGGFNVVSTAQIVSVGRKLVIPPNSFVEIKTQVREEENKKKNVVWIIVGSAIGGVIILFVLIVVLWKFGFFKRKMPPRDGGQY